MTTSRTGPWCFALLLSMAAWAGGVRYPEQRPVRTLAVQPGQTTAVRIDEHAALDAGEEVSVSLRGRLLQANDAREHDGKLMLVVSAELAGATPVHALLQIPLASVAEAYGESRSCRIGADGVPSVTWTAGLDEKNFVGFKPGAPEREFRLLLNKYLCRLLAAPVQCGARRIDLPRDVAQWRLGRLTQVVIQSRGAPASVDVSDVTLWDSGKRFDYAACAALAPSEGLCCVGGRTTAWHCGVAPAGRGWHQVSGDCFHRETGGSCKD